MNTINQYKHYIYAQSNTEEQGTFSCGSHARNKMKMLGPNQKPFLLCPNQTGPPQSHLDKKPHRAQRCTVAS